MHQTRIINSILVTATMITSCIKPYEPEFLAADEHKYVVSGQVSAGDSLQTVNVSVTSPFDAAHYIPVEQCQVYIYDDKGNKFFLHSISDGYYTGLIDPAFLQPGTSFKVEVQTPDHDILESDFDKMPGGGDLDSVYYIRKDVEGKDPGQFILGIQFYADMRGSITDSRYYRLESIDTWEYHADYPLEWYYDGIFHHVYPPDSSRMVCWRTHRVPNIYTLNTTNLAENKYYLFPLQYIDNRTTKLAYGYSLQVRLSALSQSAFIYWEQLRFNSDPQGGLYEKQPIAVKGNMHNLTNPSSEVLGFFAATSVKTKRIFVHDVPDLPLDFTTYCFPEDPVGPFGKIKPIDYPVYVIGDRYGHTYTILNHECVDCLTLGGINIKPSFWPN